MVLKKLSFLPVLILLFASCQQKQKDKRIIDKEKNITGLPTNDKRFLELKDTAQKHMAEFIEAFQKNRRDTNYYFIIKSDYVENETHEHMWASPIAFRNGLFKCIFTDSAYNITNIYPGDTVVVMTKDIEDWVIFDNYTKTKKGSFSEKYLNGEE